MRRGGIDDILAPLRNAPDATSWAKDLEWASHELLSRPGAAGLIMVALLEDQEDDDLYLVVELLEGVLNAARMAQENSQPMGAAFLGAIEAELRHHADADALDPTRRIALGRAFVRAGLPPSPHVALTEDALLGMPIDGADLPDIEPLLDSLLDEAGSEPFAIYSALSEMLATLPHPVAGEIAKRLAQRPDPALARVGTYWLLDPAPQMRQVAAEGLLSRAEAGQMDAAHLGALVGIRPWLPDDPARQTLDAAIRHAIRRDASGGALPKPWTLHRILASIPDGAGAQSIAILAQSGRNRAVAMLLLKQGFGLRDAYLVPCACANEQKAMAASIADQIDAVEVTESYLHQALATALGEGVDEGVPPAPGFLDVAEACGFQDLRPEARSVQDLLEFVGSEAGLTEISPQRLGRLVRRIEDWPEDYDVVSSWFEDTEELQDRLAGITAERSREREMWRHLETRRDWWARVFARTALTLNAADDPGWVGFAATAHALTQGRALKKTPIMEHIAWVSLQTPALGGDVQDVPHPGLAPEVPPEKKGELARLLKHAGITSDWLDGYLMATVVAPKRINPGDWVNPLLMEVMSLPNERDLQRFLDIVMLRYNTCNEAAADVAGLRAKFNKLPAAGWADWASGFMTVCAEFKSGWPTRSLKKDDKAMLRLINEAVSTEDPTLLLRTLPSWLAQRFDLRQ